VAEHLPYKQEVLSPNSRLQKKKKKKEMLCKLQHMLQIIIYPYYNIIIHNSSFLDLDIISV
jgi:hypothetical protein